MLTDQQWNEWEMIVEGARAALMRRGAPEDQSVRLNTLIAVDAELQRLEHIKELARRATGELRCHCAVGDRCTLHRLIDALALADSPHGG